MKVVAFRHVPFEGLGLIAPALKAAGLEWDYIDLPLQKAELPSLESIAGLILMGGPMSVNDGLGYLQREIEYIELAVQRNKPVLGVCLGAQLLARALGACVYRNQVREIGWFPVSWMEEARNDVLFQGISNETVFHWHGETFDLPAGATWLARSEDCRHQAFRFGAAYGLQFHLEVTPEMISNWCDEDANCGDVRELPAPIDPFHNAARLSELAALVFGRWAQLALEREAA